MPASSSPSPARCWTDAQACRTASRLSPRRVTSTRLHRSTRCRQRRWAAPHGEIRLVEGVDGCRTGSSTGGRTTGRRGVGASGTVVECSPRTARPPARHRCAAVVHQSGPGHRGGKASVLPEPEPPRVRRTRRLRRRQPACAPPAACVGGARGDAAEPDAGQLRAQLAGKDAEYDIAVEQYNQRSPMRCARSPISSSRSAASKDSACSSRRRLRSRANRTTWRSRATGRAGNYLQVVSAEQPLLEQRSLDAELSARALELSINLVRALGGGYEAPAARISMTTGK